mmetsp:Transcript_27570/g.92603  ORF Transcript_27570/g.92603 Transcript_27570/m.92603 type:complete len:344 (-) Transcript_27570:442-1473(-)
MASCARRLITDAPELARAAAETRGSSNTSGTGTGSLMKDAVDAGASAPAAASSVAASSATAPNAASTAASNAASSSKSASTAASSSAVSSASTAGESSSAASSSSVAFFHASSSSSSSSSFGASSSICSDSRALAALRCFFEPLENPLCFFCSRAYASCILRNWAGSPPLSGCAVRAFLWYARFRACMPFSSPFGASARPRMSKSVDPRSFKTADSSTDFVCLRCWIASIRSVKTCAVSASASHTAAQHESTNCRSTAMRRRQSRPLPSDSPARRLQRRRSKVQLICSAVSFHAQLSNSASSEAASPANNKASLTHSSMTNRMAASAPPSKTVLWTQDRLSRP